MSTLLHANVFCFYAKIESENVLVIFISRFIICANCIFSLYAFPFTHFEDDEECNNDLTTNGWIFDMPSCFALHNSFFVFILFNNFSSSYLHLCSLLYTSFSFVILYSFSITLFALMLMRTLELWKCSQLPTTNKNHFQWLPLFFLSLNFHSSFYLLIIF